MKLHYYFGSQNRSHLNSCRLKLPGAIALLSASCASASLAITPGFAQLPQVSIAPTVARQSPSVSLQLWHSLSGHQSPIFGVRALAISPSGKLLVSGGREGKVILWHLRSGKKLREWLAHPEGVESLALSRDGKTLVTGGIDREVKVWNLATGRLLYTINGHSAPIEQVKFSPDGRIFASGSDDLTIKLWELSSGKLVATLTGLIGYPSDVVFTPDRRQLISSEKGTTTSTIQIWDLVTQKKIRQLTTPDSGMDRIALTQNGRYLIGVGFGQLVAPHQAIHALKLWDLTTGKIVDEFPENQESLATLALSRDGKIMVCGTDDGSLQIWDLPHRKLLTRSPNYGQAIVSLAMDAPSQILVGSLTNGLINVWKINY